MVATGGASAGVVAATLMLGDVVVAVASVSGHFSGRCYSRPLPNEGGANGG
jgi:hypothetical protein